MESVCHLPDNQRARLQCELPKFLTTLGQPPWYQWVLLLLILSRIAIAPLASHELDNASLISVSRRFFEYDLPIVDHWNKTVLAIVPLVTQYALYMKTLDWFHANHNALLLLTITKIPMLAGDLLIAYLLYRIIVYIKGEKQLGRLAILIWLINPLPFWWSTISGSYAIFAPVCIVFAIYLALTRRQILCLLCLSVASALYYYPLVLLPLFLFYFLTTGKHKGLIASVRFLAKRTIAFGLFVVVQYIPFLAAEDGGYYLRQAVTSLAFHTNPAGTRSTHRALDVVPMVDISWLKWPYMKLTGIEPNSLNSPALIRFSGYMTLVGPLLAAVCIGVLFYQLFLSKKGGDDAYRYGIDRLLLDSLLVLSVSLSTCGNMHESFFLWLLPFYIVYSLAHSDYRLLVMGLVLGVVTCFRNAAYQGIWMNLFQLDDLFHIFSWGTPSHAALPGLVKMLLILSGIAVAVTRGRHKQHQLAPIGLSMALAGLVIVFLNWQGMQLYSALAANEMPVSTRLSAGEEASMTYRLYPADATLEVVDSQYVLLKTSLIRPTAHSDSLTVWKYIVGHERVRQRFSFTLFVRGISAQRVKRVSINGCMPSLVESTGEGTYYDFARCVTPVSTDSFQVALILDEDTLKAKPESNVFAFLVGIPQQTYIASKEYLVDWFTAMGIALSATFPLLIGKLLVV